MGAALAATADTAATFLDKQFDVAPHRIGLPIGIRGTDALMSALAAVSGRPVPSRYQEERGRLLDALVDGHKYVNNLKAVVYGEADLVAGMVSFLSEIGILPIICATGDKDGHLAPVVEAILTTAQCDQVQVIEGVDFVELEDKVRQVKPDLLIGHSKGYSLSRRLGIPLVRIGFPIHDRVGGSRLLHIGYQGTQTIFDRIANTVIEGRQADSDVGYTYM
jgi:nitrogenase molybdenum-iron protein NifN